MWRKLLGLLLFAVLLLALALTSMRRKSATFDEELTRPSLFIFHISAAPNLLSRA